MWNQLCAFIMCTMFCQHIINLKATVTLTFDGLISKLIGIIYTPIQMSVPNLRNLGQLCLLIIQARFGLYVVLGFNTTFNSYGHIMAVVYTFVFPGFLKPVLTQLFFPKPPTTFLTCFCRGERQKYAREKNCLNQGSNSQPPGHESDTLTTEPPGRGDRVANYPHNKGRQL